MTENNLEALATDAPPTVMPQVLVETGLADGYVSHPGPAGEMFVSFNARAGGILFIEISPDGAIREGAVTAAGKGRIEFTVADKWRRVVTLPAKGKPATWIERKEKDEWKKQ